MVFNKVKHINIFLFVIILFAAVLRLYKLGVVPVGVTHDELGYFYNAYSIAMTGRNVFGEFLPFLTWMNPTGNPFLPVPTYITALFFFVFSLSATTARLPAALIGILDVFLIFILVRQIFKNSTLALLSGLFLAISPWHLHFSRSAYDPNYALFLYLLAIVLFIFENTKRKIPIFSLISFLLAVYSYRGMNIIFPPIAILLTWYALKVIKINIKGILIFLTGISIILIFLYSTAVIYGSKYTAEAATIFNNPKMQEDIDIQIREASGPLYIRRLFLNKPTYIISKLRENYIRSYSPEFLFLYTEPNKIYSIWQRGRIYFLDILFIILGFVFIFKLNARGAIFISLLFIIGGLPGMLGGLPYSARNFLLSAIFPILSAGGILYSIHFFSKIHLKLAVIIIIAVGYSYVFFGYIFDYYNRYSLYGAEPWFKSLKDISNVINTEKKNYDFAVVGAASFADFIQYGFYTRIDPRDIQNAWAKRRDYKGIESYKYNSVVYTLACIPVNNLNQYFGNHSVIYITRENCNNESTSSTIIKDYFGNTLWRIFKVTSSTP